MSRWRPLPYIFYTVTLHVSHREKNIVKLTNSWVKTVRMLIFFFHQAEFTVLSCKDNGFWHFLAKLQFSAFIPLLVLFGKVKPIAVYHSDSCSYLIISQLPLSKLIQQMPTNHSSNNNIFGKFLFYFFQRCN